VKHTVTVALTIPQLNTVLGAISECTDGNARDFSNMQECGIVNRRVLLAATDTLPKPATNVHGRLHDVILQPTSLAATPFQALADIPSGARMVRQSPQPEYPERLPPGFPGSRRFHGLCGVAAAGAVPSDNPRAHVIAWHEDLTRRGLAHTSIRRKPAALSSLYAYLCERYAVLHIPVLGVKHLRSMNRDGVTPAPGDHQACRLLEAQSAEMLTGKRDRAILATLLYHALRREELCALKVVDIQQREGVPHPRVAGRGVKVRYLPATPTALRRMYDKRRSRPEDSPTFKVRY